MTEKEYLDILRRLEKLEKSREITIRQIDKLFHELQEHMTKDDGNEKRMVHSDSQYDNKGNEKAKL